MGLHRHGSIDPTNLADVNKGFNSPANMPLFWKGLPPQRFTPSLSFIFGMDNDTVGVAERTLKEIRTWPAGCPFLDCSRHSSDSAFTKGWKRLGD